MPPPKPDLDPSSDICPICKSNRYLNPSLQFLINPECYHKMCSTCVDRIFTSGPASCPVPYCGRTLRKKGFHKAFFSDLKVERECDVRKRVGSVFNRREDEFVGLREWNDYLEEVEGLVFDICYGEKAERESAERRVLEYKRSNVEDIEENRVSALQDQELQRRRELQEKEAVRARRAKAIQEEMEERQSRDQLSRDVLERLANTDEDATTITQNAQKVILKRASGRRNFNETTEPNGSAASGGGLTIRGLKKKEKKVEEAAYDPFGGVDLTPSRYVLQDDYESEWLASAKRDERHMAGGYSLHEYYTRTMFEAFSGLGVFVGEEVGTRKSNQVVGDEGIGTRVAVEVAGVKIKLEHKMELDDVF
jgi:CDK-activating kinase assembly factor MAT1